MPCLVRVALLIALPVFLLVSAPRAFATTIDPFTWEELVLNADFVGIIECTTAGGIVAHYKVVDSLKGREAGEQLALRIALNYWGGQFTTALVGERYLVAAFREAPASMVSTSAGGPVPLWWREIPADYATPLLQGRISLPLPGGNEPLRGIGSPHDSIETFWDEALSLLASSPEEQEERLLRNQAEKYLFGDRWRQALPEDSPIREEIADAEGADAIIEILLKVSRRQQDGPSYPVYAALNRGGREVTLRILEAMPTETSALGEEYHRSLLAGLRRKLGLEADPGGPPEGWDIPVPTDEEVAAMRALLKQMAPLEEVGEAIEVLTVHDPEPVARYLVDWENPGGDWRSENMGYLLGSYFVREVTENRADHLRTLLNARDPYVRVAGAVYLCFESEEEGMDQLSEMINLDGLPGVWAALTLARRGDKAAVEHALSVFRHRPETGEGDLNHYRNFEDRVRVLLSNSANASGIPQPQPPRPAWFDEEGMEEIRRYYVEWWDEHRNEAVLYDPWLELLEAQKVD